MRVKWEWMTAAAAALAMLAYVIFGKSSLLQIGLVLLALAVLTRLRKKVPVSERAEDRGIGHFKTEVCKDSLRFSDVAANDEALNSLRQIADFLKQPEKYRRMGARIPHGVLLYGPPGTGKTLMARALSGEAGVAFFPLSGSDFVQMYAGVGASRVRELFAKARKAGKCVIFIDEIDAMGKSRSDYGSDEREQTLNALLSEMSGFRPGDGIVVVAATNRLDTLDPALTRPGRFDRLIEVGLPDRRARLDILRLHAKNKPMSVLVDLDKLAGDTVRFSGAALENLLNEAAILAARRDARQIEPEDIRHAYYRAAAGEDKPAVSAQSELAEIALHEAGHAVAAHCLEPGQRLMRLSILPAGRGAAGYNLSVPEEHVTLSRAQLLHQIQILLAGRAAERLIDPENGLTSGASNDLARAGELSAAMILDLGMGREEAVCLRSLEKSCGAQSGAIDQCRELLGAQYEAVTALLSEHSGCLLALTQTLLREETMDEERIGRFFREHEQKNA